MLREFTALVAKSSLSDMVDNPQEYSRDACDQCAVRGILRYLWDGYMDCWVILDADGRYWDLQDQIEIPSREEYVNEYRSFDSLEALIAHMEETLS